MEPKNKINLFDPKKRDIAVIKATQGKVTEMIGAVSNLTDDLAKKRLRTYEVKNMLDKLKKIDYYLKWIADRPKEYSTWVDGLNLLIRDWNNGLKSVKVPRT